MREFQLHLKYDEMPLLKRGDVVIIEFDLEQGFNKRNLQTMSRGKIMLKDLSDLVAANEKHQKGICNTTETKGQTYIKVDLSRRRNNWPKMVSLDNLWVTVHCRKLQTAHTFRPVVN